MAGEATALAPERTARQHYQLTFAAIALASTAVAMLQSIVSPALPEIQRVLGTSTTAATWIMTAYLVSSAVLAPILGRLGDMYGKDRVMLISLGFLALGTALSAVATSAAVMIAGRVVQGAGGAVYPLGYGIIRDEFPHDKVAAGIARTSAVLGIGAGIGVVLSGPIVDVAGYHWLFWVPFIMEIVALVGTILFVPRSPVRVPGRVSWLGALLLSGWLVCVLLGVSQGNAWGWTDGRTLGLFAAGAVLFVVWVLVELRSAEPLIDMAMMRIRGVWTVNAAAFLMGWGNFVSFVLLPQFVEVPADSGYGFGASVTQAGLFLLPMTIMMMPAASAASRLGATRGPRLPMIVGALACAAAFAFLAIATPARWEIYLASAVLGFGVGLGFASLANLIVGAVRPDQTGAATGMNTVTRVIGASVGATVCATLLERSIVGATGLPTEAAFDLAFGVSAVACLLAAAFTLLAPRPRALTRAVEI